MTSNYSSYQYIDPFYFTLFDRLWARYIPKLPVLPTDIQNEENTKAAVFNLWVNFYNVKEYLMIQTDKTFSHAYEEHLANRLKIGVPDYLKPILQSYRSKHHHAFLYSYFLTFKVFQELTIFVTKHAYIKAPMLKKYNYYYSDDYDFNPTDEVFHIMKILNYEFLQLHLTQQICEQMHAFAYNGLKQYLNETIH